MTVVLGTLWCSVKHIEAPYVFDWEHGIALHPMQGIRALTHADGDVSWDFSSCSRNLGIVSSYSWDGRSKLHLVHPSQGSGLVRTATSGNLTRFGRIIQTLLEVRWETKPPFLVSTEILGFLSILKKCQASAPFEALKSNGLWRCQRM